MQITALELHDRLDGGHPPAILDVRNAIEFGRWKLEGRANAPQLNVPYFEFLEREDEAVERVRRWREGRDDAVVVVCARGDSSELVAEVLRAHGTPAENLTGGMVAWGNATGWRPVAAPAPLRAWQACRFGKGCLSYVIAAGRDAVVVDPHRHTAEYTGFLDRQGLELRAVLDTHLHADHVCGAPALAALREVPLHGHPADFDGAGYRFVALRDRAAIALGDVEVVALLPLHGPGHTPGSTLLLVQDALLLTGDTLFVHGVGRPDLGGKVDAWGRDLLRTLQQRIAAVGDGVVVLPAHASGPQEAGPDGIFAAPLGELRRANAAFRSSAQAFVDELHAKLIPPPAQYERIRRINLGHEPVTEDEVVEMELGKNQCALKESTR